MSIPKQHYILKLIKPEVKVLTEIKGPVEELIFQLIPIDTEPRKQQPVKPKCRDCNRRATAWTNLDGERVGFCGACI